MGTMRNPVLPSLGLLLALLPAACNTPNFDPSKATREYPFELHTTATLPIQVFRDGTTIEIVNSTDNHWGESSLWINQQYMRLISGLAPGQRLTLDLNDFRNDIGEVFRAGGFFRTRQPTPVRLVEIQPGEGQPLIGFVTIRGGDLE
jgi:hypothetical protein